MSMDSSIGQPRSKVTTYNFGGISLEYKSLIDGDGNVTDSYSVATSAPDRKQSSGVSMKVLVLVIAVALFGLFVGTGPLKPLVSQVVYLFKGDLKSAPAGTAPSGAQPSQKWSAPQGPRGQVSHSSGSSGSAGSSSKCKDSLEVAHSCPGWAASGRCNTALVVDSCPATCGLCPPEEEEADQAGSKGEDGDEEDEDVEGINGTVIKGGYSKWVLSFPESPRFAGGHDINRTVWQEQYKRLPPHEQNLVYAEKVLEAGFLEEKDIHRALFKGNCNLTACRAPSQFDEAGPPGGVWWSGGPEGRDPSFAYSTITGKPCKYPDGRPVTFNPFNLVSQYQEEQWRIRALLSCSASFAFLRFNDGERDAIRKSLKFNRVYKGLSADRTQQDLDEAELKETQEAMDLLSKDLRHTMKLSDSRYLVALPVPSCAQGIINEQRSGGGTHRFLRYFTQKHGQGLAPADLTYLLPFQAYSYSTLFSHRGGRSSMRMMDQILSKSPNAFVIANEQVRRKAVGQNKTWAERMEVFPSDLLQQWAGPARELYISKAMDLAKPGGKIFVVALGPVTKVLIHHMWMANSNNAYVDIGSLMDGLLNIKSRGWLDNRCQKIGRACTEVRYTIKHDVGLCSDKSCPGMPVIPHRLNKVVKKFHCKNKGKV